MTKYVHIVQVHPVENGLPNLYKVKAEREFPTLDRANDYIIEYNRIAEGKVKAVYRGRVNDATGDLE